MVVVDAEKVLSVYKDRKRYPIVRMIGGSKAYGTNTSTSDIDYREVFLPIARDIILQNSVATLTCTPQKGFKVNATDVQCYSLQNFLRMVMEGTPQAVEMLFIPDSLYVDFVPTPVWEAVLLNKHKFINLIIAEKPRRIYNAINKNALAAPNVEDHQRAWTMFAHAYRTAHEVLELLTSGIMTFPRPEAAQILKIKNKTAFKVAVEKDLENILDIIDSVKNTSFISEKPDVDFADEFIYNNYFKVITE